MKVIAKIDDDKVICEVNKKELEKYLGLYYGNLDRKCLDVGQTIDLGKAYDYKSEIVHAMSTTKEFIESHQNVIKAITDGLRIINVPDQEEDQ